MIKKYTIISLFSGCGGLDLGFLGDFVFCKKNIVKIILKLFELMI